MIYPDLLININSDAGITLGKLGKLASKADSMVITSAIHALKDIVSTEAVHAESSFMTGNAEYSSYGVYVLRVSENEKISVMYILSSDDPSTIVNQTNVLLVQEACIALGQQLMQSQEFIENAIKGQHVTREVLLNAFINSALIARNYFKTIAINEELFTKTLNEKIMALQHEIMEYESLEHLKTIKKWKKTSKDWVNGRPNTKRREQLFTELVNEVLFKIIDSNPLGVLSLQDPRQAKEKTKETLKQFLEEYFTKNEPGFVSTLKKHLSKSRDTYNKKITLSDLHLFHREILIDALIKTYKEIVSKNPLMYYYRMKTKDLQNIMDECMKDTSMTTFPELIVQTLTPHANMKTVKWSKLFFENYLRELKTEPITKANWIVITTYLKNLVSLQEFLKTWKTVTTNKQWQTELEKNIKAKPPKTIPIKSINEGHNISNGIIKSTVEVVLAILKEYFSTTKEFGIVFKEFIAQSLEISPTVEFLSFLISLTNTLTVLNLPTEFILPTPIDIIAANYEIQNQKMELYADDENIQRSKGFFKKKKYTWKQEKHDLVDILTQSQNIVLFIEEMPYQLFSLRNDPLQLAILYKDPQIILPALKFALQRNIKQKTKIIDENIEHNQVVLRNLVKSNLSILKTLKQIPLLPKQLSESFPRFSKLQEKIKEMNQKISLLQADTSSVKQVKKPLLNDFKQWKTEKEKSIEESLQELQGQAKFIEAKLQDHPFYEGIQNFLQLQQDYKSLLEKIRSAHKQNELRENALKIVFSDHIFERIPESILEVGMDDLFLHSNIKEIQTSEDLRDLIFDAKLDVYSMVRKYKDTLTLISKNLLQADYPIQIENGEVFIEAFKVSQEKIQSPEIIANVFSFPNIKIEKSRGMWRGKLVFEDFKGFHPIRPVLVMFSDLIRIRILKQLQEDVDPILNALKEITAFIDEGIPEKIEDMFNEFKTIIFPDHEVIPSLEE